MTANCPICHRPHTSSTHAPFCSTRCKEVDLGRWLSDHYVAQGEDGEALTTLDEDQIEELYSFRKGFSQC